MAPSWHGLLKDADDEPAVIGVVRDFVARLDLNELRALPPHCRPGKFFEANDVTSFAFEIVRYQCGENDPAEQIVHKMAAFFSHASIRLSELAIRTNDPDVEEVDSA